MRLAAGRIFISSLSLLFLHSSSSIDEPTSLDSIFKYSVGVGWLVGRAAGWVLGVGMRLL
jgi:hypothetical protein